jgi:hypothetical protein
MKRLVALVMCLASLTALFGCGKKDRFILDGPGMINPASWDSFSVSRSDSYAQHNFYINVEVRNEGLVVTGEVRGEDGTVYVDEEGILLPAEASRAIFDLKPALLPDRQPVSEPGLEGVEILDAAFLTIEVICTDGRVLKKVDEDDFSIEIYQIVMPYFEKKHGQ